MRTMNTIPTITEQDIRTLVGEQNFLKGQQSARDGAIVNPAQGHDLYMSQAALVFTLSRTVL